jgi:hypothetical protein
LKRALISSCVIVIHSMRYGASSPSRARKRTGCSECAGRVRRWGCRVNSGARGEITHRNRLPDTCSAADANYLSRHKIKNHQKLAHTPSASGHCVLRILPIKGSALGRWSVLDRFPASVTEAVMREAVCVSGGAAQRLSGST